MTKLKKHFSYNLYRITKSKQHSLLKALRQAKMTAAGKKEINGWQLSLYVSTQASSPVWWTDLYHDYFQSQPAPENELYYATFIVTKGPLCYAITLGKAYLFVKDYADASFGRKLAERITDLSWQNEADSSLLETDHNHSVTAATTNERWGDYITFGQSVQFDIPIKPDQLPQFIQRIEAELTKEFDPKTQPIKTTTKGRLVTKDGAACLQCGQAKQNNYCTACDQKTGQGINIVLNDPFVLISTDKDTKQ